MNLPNLPTPDELLRLFLTFAVGQGVLLSLLMIILALRSWYMTLRDGIEKGRIAIGLSGKMFRHMKRMRRIGLFLLMLSSVIMLSADVMWLLVNYVIGNLLSGAVGLNQGLHLLLNSDLEPSWWQFDGLLRLLRMDVISGSYVLLSFFGLAAAYRHANRGTSADGLGNFFALPGYLYGFCGLVGGALSLVANFLSNGHYASERWIIFMFGAGVVGSLYVLVCRVVMRAPALIGQMWSDRSHFAK